MVNGKEVVINLKDLFAYVLKRWVYILLGMIICGTIVGGYRAVSFYIDNKDKYGEKNLNEITQSLTDIEENEVENLFNRYLAYKNSISYSESYLGKSVLMKMDPNRFPTFNVQYSICSDYRNLVNFFTDQTLGIAEYEKIADVFGDDTDTTSISELVKISGTYTDKDGISLDVDSQNNMYVGGFNNVYKWMMNVTVYAYDKAQCETIMGIVENAIQAQYDKLSDAGIDATITKVGSNYTENASQWLIDRQREMISETSTLKAEYDKFEKEELSHLSSEEKVYFEFLKNRYEGKHESRHFVKYICIGIVLGGVIVGAFILLSYFLSDRIKNKEDYLYRTRNDDVIGIIYSNTKHKGIIVRLVNRIINSIFYGIGRDYNSTESATIIAKRIKRICNEENISELYIIDESTKKSAESCLNTIKEYLFSEGISISCGTPLASSEDYDAFGQAKAVIYYGSFYDSKLETLSDYLKFFKENRSQVLGSVLHSEI